MKARQINHYLKPGTFFRSAAIFISILCSNSNLYAQCKTAVLNINTGVNYNLTTPAPITAGNPDPEWKIINVSPATQAAAGIGGTPPTIVASIGGLTANNATRSWITFNAAGTYPTNVGPVYTLTFRRQFTLCEQDEVRFDIKAARDNYISSMTINGVFEFSEPATAAPPNFTNPPATLGLAVPVMTLPAGTYNIDIVVNNADVVHATNAHGLMLDGTISSTSGKQTIRQNGYTTCDCDCSDKCYWKVQGNNILSGNNIFGTLTNDAVRIFTNNTQRGIISSSGNLGWNTATPSALLHVNCATMNNTSQIRFQGLATNNKGNLMLIDPATGLVYDSGLPPGGGQNLCFNTNFVPKVTSTTGNMNCSQIYDDGITVGIGATSGFTYSSLSGGRLGVTVPPSTGTVRLEVNGVERSLAEIVTSDANYKDNINPIPNALSIIKDLNGHTFTWNSSAKAQWNADDGLHIGFIAQELQTVLPEVVIEDNNGDLGVNYIEIIPLLTEAIKEQQIQIDELTNALQQASGNKQTLGNGYLEQNSPNPFSVSTEIKYQLPQGTANGQLGVYDMNGREIRLINLSSAQPAGSVTIKAGDLKAGMYIYTLIVDGKYFDSKKMILTSR